jgi:nicotinamide riboside kinase
MKIAKQSIGRIVVIGPESTGKSTLSADLAQALGTVWRPETARAYLDVIDRPYEETDLLAIARVQQEEERVLINHAARWIILDTDCHVLRVWSESRYGRCHPEILTTVASARPSLYLLTDIDLPWEPDPQREHPDPADRRRFWHQYRQAAIDSGVPWSPIAGDRQQRLTTALAAIETLSAND